MCLSANGKMKKMKRFYLWVLLLSSLGMNAQTAKDSTVWNKDPLYLQLFLGINKSANENLPWTEFSGYPWSTGMFFAIGREVKPLWGWRAALRINRNKSRNVPVCESKDVWKWSSTSLFADVTFDVTDVLRRRGKRDTVPVLEGEVADLVSYRDSIKARNKPSRFNLKAFAGLGASYTWNFEFCCFYFS